MIFSATPTPLTRFLRAGALALTLSACSEQPQHGAGVSTAPVYSAKIQRTEGGVPHITAPDFGSLGFGTGYAAAEDNFCALSRQFRKLRGELSLAFGAGDDNPNSDFFYKLLAQQGVYAAPVDAEMAAMFAGYAQGFNQYLRETGVANISDPDCRGAGWVTPITAEDVKRVHLTPFFLPNFSPMILAAAPPAGKTGTAPPMPLDPERIGNPRDKGSNGVAIGRELSANGKGLLFANPHLDWQNNIHFYPMHQIIPGVLNLLGASTFDRASVGVGTNGDVAWTNTVSTAQRFAFYSLPLVQGQPTRYRVDGQERALEAITVSIQVKRGDGNLETRSHTFYRSHLGFIVGGAFPWSAERAVALRIADEGARAMQGATMAAYRAKNVAELKEVYAKYQYMTVNLIAADKNGEVLYADMGPMANFTDRQLTECALAPNLYRADADCQWHNDADAAAPGLLGASKQPALLRGDYVTNSNDSYWLANPNAPLQGFARVLGSAESARTLRTRSGLLMIQKRMDGSDGLPGKRFDIDSLLTVMMSDQHYAGQLLRDDVVTLCRKNPEVKLDGNRVDLRQACAVLAAWDLHANVDSRGAHLFREFLREAHGKNGGDTQRWLPEAFRYRVPFDLKEPLTTPRGLDVDNNPAVLDALARAVKKLRDAGLALDARLGDLQAVTRNGEKIPLHGGAEMEGVFNKISAAFAGGKGYPEVTGSSSSWISATEFTDAGPRVKAILTYSLSMNTASPHYADQTRMFSEKRWLDIPYQPEAVDANAVSTRVVSLGADVCANEGWKTFTPAFASPLACVEHFNTLKTHRLSNFTH